jgi:hypothetical protein
MLCLPMVVGHMAIAIVKRRQVVKLRQQDHKTQQQDRRLTASHHRLWTVGSRQIVVAVNMNAINEPMFEQSVESGSQEFKLILGSR